MQNEGNDWEIEGDVQELFAQIIMSEVTAKSGIIDDNAEFENESALVLWLLKMVKERKVCQSKRICWGSSHYVTNEIATAIVVDKNGKLISYPDKGYYNGLKI